jgi:SAM-dependent methyltransferase
LKANLGNSPNMVMQEQGFAGYWDAILSEARRGPDLRIWRRYMKRVYARLLQSWHVMENHRCLKTDLFEEAVTSDAILQDLGRCAVGVDISHKVAFAARNRLASQHISPTCFVGDLRLLALKSGSFDCVISGSSLDHFQSEWEIAASLAELARVLEPGGVLILTLDNPHNPVVWLRNELPYSWLYRMHLVPYYVGETCTREQACARLESLGLKVTDMCSVVHVPRAPAIWLTLLVQLLGYRPLEEIVLRAAEAFEVLVKLPSRYLSGYFLAFRAEKIAAPPGSAT